MNLGPRFGPRTYFEHLVTGDAAKLGTAEGRHMPPAVLLEPGGRALIGDDGGNRVNAAGETFAAHYHVWLYAVGFDAPHLAGPHEACLHLVGNEQGSCPFAHLLDSFEIALRRHWKSIGRRDRLDDHAGGIALLDLTLHGIEVSKGNLRYFIGSGFREEQLGKAIVSDLHCQTRVSMIAALETDDPPALGGVAGGFKSDVDGLATA